MIHHGDCLEVMRAMEPNSIDAIVTDPPYGLSFMGKHWDHGVPGVAFWDAALRVAKPGTYLLAFGGARTYHRMTCAIEDAGWEIHDCLCWLYGSGFPKHKSKLKPAYEPIVMARKPAPKATPLNIDACRLGDETRTYRGGGAQPSKLANHGPGDTGIGLMDGRGRDLQYTVTGRWPANVCCDEEAARLIDEASGERSYNPPAVWRSAGEGTTGDQTYGAGIGKRDAGEIRSGYGDTGGASRFYYCAKASRSEREAGLDGFPALRPVFGDDGGTYQGLSNSKSKRANGHPTVKPVALMRWLVRLVTPPDGIVLDPFAGSFTTGVAATMEGRRFIGVEREAEYVEIGRARIAHAQPALGVA